MNIYNMTFSALEDYFTERGENKAKAKIVYNYIYRKTGELSSKVAQMLETDFDFKSIEILETVSCSDAVKFLFGLHDNNTVEAVLMRHDYGSALCVSTQVGCNMNCAFCQSGAMKKARDLQPFEMVLQLLEAEKNLGEKISRVTLMGIGEPLDNFENVMDFIDIIGHKHGLAIAPRHITISTCGLPKLDELRDISCNLAISLHAPNDEIRSRIMPVNSAHNIERIIDFAKTRKKKTTLEYIMLAGVNDSDECARELAELVGGINCYINVIPYNETSLDFKRSGADRLKSFYSILIQSGIRATVRREFGGDIKAACGQLRADVGGAVLSVPKERNNKHMIIIAEILGIVSTNSYIVSNNGEALLIDPEVGDDALGVPHNANHLIEKCKELQIKPVAVLLTHGHFDHIGAVNGLKEALKLPVYAGKAEEHFLTDPNYNGSAKMGRTPVSVTADVLLDDGEIIELAGFKIKAIATPGHTKGGICYWFESEKILLSGDVLFADSFGRTDFPGGSQEALADSIINKLFTLPEETTVYPGHGMRTTIGREKKSNPIYGYRL